MIDTDQAATSVAATLAPLTPAEPASPDAPAMATPGDATPAWPSVLRIAYVSDGDIWLLEEGSAARLLTSSGSAVRVVISDDGAKVAFLRIVDPTGTGHTELRAVNADGTSESVLLSAADLDALYPPLEGTVGTDISQLAFIPGTHALLFNTFRIPEFIGLIKSDDLWRVEADTGVHSTVLPAGEGGDFAVSPDGSQIMIVTPRQAGLVNIDASSRRPGLISYPLVTTYSEFLFYPVPVWAADSSTAGLVVPSSDPLAPATSGTVWHLPADGGPAVSVGTISANLYINFLYQSPLSPTLERLAYTRPTADPNIHNLYVADASGGGETLVATGQIDWHGWSPDAAHFIYSVDSPLALQLGSIGGGALAIGSGMCVQWIDASHFLFLSMGDGEATLYRGNLDGTSTALATLSGDPLAYNFDD
jgi:hypothetical protein